MKDILQPLIDEFMPFAQKRMGFEKPPRVFLRDDPRNAQDPLGKTAYYDPEQMSVTLYIHGRHPKDVMRSLSHELVHHMQNCNGQFEYTGDMGEGYAQSDPHLREMEREAYEMGNLCLRDWTDTRNSTIYNVSLQEGAKKKMSTKDWKNNELRTLLSEKWGFSFNLLNEGKEEAELDEAKHKDEDLDEARGMAMPMGTKTLQPEGEMIVFSDGRFNVDVTGFGAVSGRIDEGDLEALMDPMAEGAASGRAADPSRAQGGDRREDDERKRPMEESGRMFAPNHYCIHHGGVERNGSVELAEAVAHNYNEKLGRVTHYDMKFSDGTIMENVASEDIQVTNASLAEGHGSHPAKKDEPEDLDEAEKPDFPDVDGDGDREEPISKASKEKKEKEGGKKEKSEKDLSKVPPQLRKHMKKKMSESQIREIIRNLFKEAMAKKAK